MNELDAWVAAACAELGLQPDDVKAGVVLDVARDVAHQVLRPGAPVSAYLMGVAVGRGADPSDVADRLSALALGWPARKAGAENVPPAESLAPTRKAGAENAPPAESLVPARKAGAENVPPARAAESLVAAAAEGRDAESRAPGRRGEGRSGDGDAADPPIP